MRPSSVSPVSSQHYRQTGWGRQEKRASPNLEPTLNVVAWQMELDDTARIVGREAMPVLEIS